MYGRVEDLLRLALMMQGLRGGVSLADIQEAFAVSRSTADRMRDAVRRAFPQVEEVEREFGERVKRWRMPAGVLQRSVAFEAAELEDLRLAAERLRSEGLGERAAALDGVRAKVAALMTPQARTRVEPDLETLLEAEGHAMRPGPRPGISEGLLGTLREALVACRVISARYLRRIGGRETVVELEPHGILFGQRHYLVAFPHRTTARLPKLYALANLSEATVTATGFDRRTGFDLKSYAARSFGVFQEEPVEVVWRFGPELAGDALEHHFHPTERKRRLEDGTVEVRFTAGGQLEMCWHLFTWGPGVEVVSPRSLRVRYAELLATTHAAAALHEQRRPG